ncbi:MAG: Transcription-repair-coupling factor [Holosporales bacterium]
MENTAQKMTSPHATVGGIPAGYIPFYLKKIHKTDQVDIFIATNNEQAQMVYQQMQVIAPHVTVFYLPSWDCLPYDRVGPSQDIVNQRIETLLKIATHQRGFILITSAAAYLQKLPPLSYYQNRVITLEKGHILSRQRLMETLTTLGYKRCETVYEAGDFAVRGSIIDIFPTGMQTPVRVDFFGDEIDTLRLFQVDTQTTVKNQDPVLKIVLKPACEILWDEKAIDLFKARYKALSDNSGLEDDELYMSISHGRVFQGQEHWSPLALLEDFVPIEAYAGKKACHIYADYRVESIILDMQSLILDYFNARAYGDFDYRPVPVCDFYRVQDDLNYTILSPLVETHDETGRMLLDFPSRTNNPDFFEDVTAYIQKRTHRVYLACVSEGVKDRVLDLLTQDVDVQIFIMPTEKGFYTKEFTLITDQDILGERQRLTRIKKQNHQRFFQELTNINIQDLIVHKDHGIGRYLGLETLQINDLAHDCLVLAYDDGDKLYVPVENMELISRYGGANALTQLDKLGSSTWQNKKGKAKKRIELIADYLLQLAAERTERQGAIFKKDEDTYHTFCQRFPYVETDDQYSAIEDVIRDLGSGKPMDRLICGDVGFGKTEVALRAAFLTACNGKQVAIVTPTTLLCRQHTLNFTKRFEETGYVVKQLSRLTKHKEIQEIKKGIATGDVHIVVATHAILAEDVRFKDLGLLIVDEEQHFGVNQKEKLKTRYSDVHSLTLTATPIPRTLQLSLSGVRELSLITTPPQDRLPVRTTVCPQDSITLKEAIMREVNRGGQVFYVCPHVKDQKEIQKMLDKILPDLRYVTLSGRLSPPEIEDAIGAFCDRHYDLLLATNIIESGIDMPSVNTIILHNAHLFGLAQLYQLRGRVGRSKKQAYAYFTVPTHRALKDYAAKRLEILQSLDTLGAGFNLANHDMDLRGAGNILGEEQSGHIKEIGVELYQQLLQETILMAKAKQEGKAYVEEWTPQINLGGAVLIPQMYVADLSLRLSLYKRLSNMTDAQEINAFSAELVDRFGKYPVEVRNLLQVCELKLLSKQAYVEKIEVGPKGFVIGFYQNTFPKPDALLNWIQSKEMVSISKIRSDQKIFIQFQSADDLKRRYAICRHFLLTLKKMLPS